MSNQANRNFILLHTSGECVFNLNFGNGNDVDTSILSGFASALGGFSKYVEGLHKGLAKGSGNIDLRRRSTKLQSTRTSLTPDGEALKLEMEGKRKVKERSECTMFEVNNELFLFRPVASFYLVLNLPGSDGRDLAERQLFEIESTLVLLLGPLDKLKRNSFQVGGLRDILERALIGTFKYPEMLVGGIPFVAKSNEVKERLDQALTALENDERTLGSLILLGGSVLHSRLSMEETRVVRMLVYLRPLEEHQRVRILPVFSEGQWKNLIIYRMKSHVLCVLVSITCGLPDVLPRLDRFGVKMNEKISQLQLPIATSILSIGGFSEIQTIAFVYHDFTNEHTLAPTIRQDPSFEMHREVLGWFIRRVQDQLQQHRIQKLHLCKGGYHFFAVEADTHELFLLCGAEIGTTEIEDEAERIISQIRLSFTL